MEYVVLGKDAEGTTSAAALVVKETKATSREQRRGKKQERDILFPCVSESERTSNRQ